MPSISLVFEKPRSLINLPLFLHDLVLIRLYFEDGFGSLHGLL